METYSMLGRVGLTRMLLKMCCRIGGFSIRRWLKTIKLMMLIEDGLDRKVVARLRCRMYTGSALVHTFSAICLAGFWIGVQFLE